MLHTVEQVLQQEFLVARAKILELAATLDRIDRADGDAENHPQVKLLRQGFEILLGPAAQRAEQVQLLFSRQYAADWRNTLNVP